MLKARVLAGVIGERRLGVFIIDSVCMLTRDDSL